jgi:uncharacterized protein (TIGR00730 family)
MLKPGHARKRICVFCGSRDSSNTRYAKAAADLGRMLAHHGIGLVYGGSAAGLMGTVAKAALERGGSVIGVIPKVLMRRETAHTALTELRVVKSLAERKSTMADLSDAFIALPGGFGTLDEIFEMVCEAQLGFHSKPCVLLNVGQFFHHLIEFLDHATQEGLISASNRKLVLEAASVDEALAKTGAVDAVAGSQGSHIERFGNQG